MGQKTSWKFLIPGVIQKSIKSLAKEITGAGKVLVQRNPEAGCVSSL